MDFSELDHSYNFVNIRESWIGGLVLTNPLTDPNEFAGAVGATTTNVLKYPFIDWTGQIGLDMTSANEFPILQTLEQAFRPAIRIKYLIDKIFASAGFNYTSEFFDTTILGGGSFNFNSLFMDFNWGADAVNNSQITGAAIYTAPDPTNFAPNGSYGALEFPTIDPPQYEWPAEAGFDNTSTFTCLEDNTRYNINYDIWLDWTGSASVTIEWLYTLDGVAQPPVDQVTYSGTSSTFKQYTGWFSVVLNDGDTLHCQFIASGLNTVKQRETGAYPSSMWGSVSMTKVTTGTLLNTLRGDLGQWEFLKGIFNMFNLVTMVDNDNPNNILIEPYSDVFINNTNSGTLSDMTLASRGVEHDWTDKVDVSQMDLKPLADLNKDTIFKFVEDDDDFAFNLYKGATGTLYGSKEFDATSIIVSPAQSTILEGVKEIIAAPFAATVSKPLYEQFPDFIVPCVFAKTDDGSHEGFENSPRIFYENYYDPNVYQTLTSCTYSVPAQNGGLGVAFEEDFLQFSHLTTLNPTVNSSPPAVTDTVDFYFGSVGYIMPIGNVAVDNLYSLYWQPYFNELYNPDTRTMTLKVNLTPADINTFKFYDVVFIRNRSFRVNKIDYKPNDLATVEFILIP